LRATVMRFELVWRFLLIVASVYLFCRMAYGVGGESLE